MIAATLTIGLAPQNHASTVSERETLRTYAYSGADPAYTIEGATVRNNKNNFTGLSVLRHNGRAVEAFKEVVVRGQAITTLSLVCAVDRMVDVYVAAREHLSDTPLTLSNGAEVVLFTSGARPDFTAEFRGYRQMAGRTYATARARIAPSDLLSPLSGASGVNIMVRDTNINSPFYFQITNRDPLNQVRPVLNECECGVAKEEQPLFVITD